MDFERAYDIISGKIETWLKELVGILPNLVLASVIVVTGLLLARVLKRFFLKGISNLIPHKSLANLCAVVFHLVLVGITLFAALSVLKLDKTVTTLLAGAGVLGLALAFAFQDIAANFVSGVFMAVSRPFKAGETIKSKDVMGVVEIVHLRDTLIRTFQGQLVRIPNKDIFQNPMINFTRLGRRRLDLVVGISYRNDLEQAETLALQAVSALPGLLPENAPKAFYKKFDDSSINLELQIWLQSGEQGDFLKAQSEAIKSIKKIFDKNGISIPFPIRTLEIGEGKI